MYFGVKVRVNVETMAEFGARLSNGTLDRGLIRSQTWCLADEPAIGFSVWEAEDPAEFERVFAAWRRYYAEAEVRELITPAEAAQRLAGSQDR
jgi:hypothetical protein